MVLPSYSEEFTGRVALVTGAAGDGIGHSTAKRLALGGATVIVTDKHARRTEEVTAEIASETGSHVLGFPFDVKDRERAEELMTEVEERVGPVTILVNNAVFNVQGDIFDYDAELFEELLEIDLTACWFMAKLAGQQMKRAGGGSIVNVGSIAADRGSSAVEPAYAMSKAAMHSLTFGLAKAGGPSNIRANEVTMGIVSQTKFMDQRPELLKEMLPEMPLGRYAVPSDVAEAIAFLASDRASYISGTILNITGGYWFR